MNHSQYSYDPADNLVHLINGTAQTFDAANQLVSAAKPTDQNQHGDQSGHNAGASITTTYSYDLNGSRVSATAGRSTTTYAFDQANRLTNFNNQARYSYNGDGLRMSKAVNGEIQPFVWDLAEGLPLILSDAQNQYVPGPGGLPLEQISSTGQVDFFHHDQLGSTRLLSDAKGHIAAAFTFDPYGNLSNQRANGSTPLLFAGQYIDSESGLYYLRARYYDPASAQFISVDQAAATTWSRHAYVAGNPLNLTDPTGHIFWVVLAVFAIGAVVAITYLCPTVSLPQRPGEWWTCGPPPKSCAPAQAAGISPCPGSPSARPQPTPLPSFSPIPTFGPPAPASLAARTVANTVLTTAIVLKPKRC